MEIERKKYLSRLMKSAWEMVKNEQTNISFALRKSWVLNTKVNGHSWRPNMFDKQSFDLVVKDKYSGTIRILPDGFVSGRNIKNACLVFKSRHDAIKFALSNQKTSMESQLPLI